MSKLVILNIADTGALETTAYMFEAAGYEVKRPGPSLLAQIRDGCRGVYSVEDLRMTMGYDAPRVTSLAGPEDVARCELFVDVKAHVNYPAIVRKWPRLEGRVLWCCLNGGDPLSQARKDSGEPWDDPPCPILSNNQWYALTYRHEETGELYQDAKDVSRKLATGDIRELPWARKSYVSYPHYSRLADRTKMAALRRWPFDAPMCLVHNVRRWGHGELVDPFVEYGGRCYGMDCPHGVVNCASAMAMLSNASCLCYLKSGDTVGYATYEAMSMGVPVVVSDQYIEDTRLFELFEPGETCLTFDATKGWGPLRDVLTLLRQPALNSRIGENGRNRLLEVMWRPERDLDGFKAFLARNFR